MLIVGDKKAAAQRLGGEIADTVVLVLRSSNNNKLHPCNNKSSLGHILTKNTGGILSTTMTAAIDALMAVVDCFGESFYELCRMAVSFDGPRKFSLPDFQAISGGSQMTYSSQSDEATS